MDLIAPFHLTTAQLDAGLDHIRSAPHDHGTVRLVVARPADGERAVLRQARLDPAGGLAGDNWATRPSRETDDGSPHPGRQLNVMGARVIEMLAPSSDLWALAGDQLFVDLDLSVENLPAGTLLAVGSAVIEVTALPHNGCAKFTRRFGLDAMRWVNSPEGRRLRLRGICARVATAGTVSTGDAVTKLT